MRIDGAIERLAAAHRARGLPELEPPADAAAVDAVLGRIAAAIAPLRLDAELERLWRRVDVRSLWPIAPHPHPTSPDFALDIWVQHQEEFPGMTPRLLFPFCCESQSFLFVELDDGHGGGGPMFGWGYGSVTFDLAHPRLHDYLDLRAEFVEQGQIRSYEYDGRTVRTFDPEGRWRDARRARLAALAPVDRLRGETSIGGDVRDWPAHWVAAEGITPDDVHPRGATATVAALLEAAGRGVEARGTIQARVVGLAMTGEGCQATVDDGTGRLDLWCPAPTTRFGPVVRRAFEFDVVVRGGHTPLPDTTAAHHEATRRALAGDLAGAQAAVSAMYRATFEGGRTAEATAIRPLD